MSNVTLSTSATESNVGLLERTTCAETGRAMDGVSTPSLLLVTFTLPVAVPTTEVFSVTNLLIKLGDNGPVPEAVPLTLPVHATANTNGSTPVLIK